jgi:type I restriction enzyme S subunit
VPENWVWVTIADIALLIQYGYTGSAISSGKYKMLRITDIQDNTVDWKTVPFVSIEDEKANSYLLSDNDIVFARTGATVGKSFLIEDLKEKSVFASYLIRIKLKEGINVQYVKYFFESGYYWGQIEDKSVGTGQPNVNGTLLSELQIPIPPLSEQRRIVSVIESAFALIDEIEDSQTSLQQIIKQTKAKTLDLAIKGKLVNTPRHCGLDPQSPAPTTADNSPYQDLKEGWKITEMQNVCYLSDGEKIAGRKLPYLEAKYCRKKGEVTFCDSGKFVPKNSTVILVDGENSGELFFVEEDGYQGSTFKILNVSENVHKNYIFNVLQKEQATFRESKVGSAIPHLNKKLFRELPVLLPPLPEQKLIVERIENIFSILDSIQENL